MKKAIAALLIVASLLGAVALSAWCRREGSAEGVVRTHRQLLEMELQSRLADHGGDRQPEPTEAVSNTLALIKELSALEVDANLAARSASDLEPSIRTVPLLQPGSEKLLNLVKSSRRLTSMTPRYTKGDLERADLGYLVRWKKACRILSATSRVWARNGHRIESMKLLAAVLELNQCLGKKGWLVQHRVMCECDELVYDALNEVFSVEAPSGEGLAFLSESVARLTLTKPTWQDALEAECAIFRYILANYDRIALNPDRDMNLDRLVVGSEGLFSFHSRKQRIAEALIRVTMLQQEISALRDSPQIDARGRVLGVSSEEHGGIFGYLAETVPGLLNRAAVDEQNLVALQVCLAIAKRFEESGRLPEGSAELEALLKPATSPISFRNLGGDGIELQLGESGGISGEGTPRIWKLSAKRH
jgi:hypothetical protein